MRKLFERRRDLTFLYPSLVDQRPLLDALGVDGMSSDEEETILGSNVHQYRIYVPRWRSQMVTAWLRIFDHIYIRARSAGVFGHQRGAWPRARVMADNPSGSHHFVPRLPRNAYDDAWFGTLVNASDVIRPGPSAPYFHPPQVIA